MEVAALKLAAAAVSPIISKLGDVVASYFGGDITRKELRHLQTIILPKIRTVIGVAEKINAAGKIDVTILQPWLMELRGAAYEAEDIMDLYEYNKIKREACPPTPFKKLKGKARELLSFVSLKTELKNSFEELCKSANEADKLVPLLGLVNSTTPDDKTTMIRQQRLVVSGLSAPVFGRDKERDDLVNALTAVPHESSSNGRNVIVHAIHGIGGAGKTTLAQYVYKGIIPSDKDYFNLKIWIHVSQTFDITRITGEIIQYIEDLKSPPNDHLDALQRILSKDLKSKRFLLVLDDIWIEDKDRYLWDQLLIPLIESGEAGSRILVTTRREVTLQNLRVKSENILSLTELETEECWSILKYYAFDDTDKKKEDPRLIDIGNDILKKLKNSPLALRIVGCLLGKKVDIYAWRRILDTNMLEETLDVILLSFQHLPPHLQRCFTICSLYPKGFSYYSTKSNLYHFSDVNRLIQLWIAHGFVEVTGNESLEDKGRQYFDDLVSYSLFQRDFIDGYDDDSAYYYGMHDLVHDIAEKVSKDYCFRIEGGNPASIPTTVIRLSIMKGELHLHMPNILKLAKLRTFVIFPSYVLAVKFNNAIEHTIEMFTKLTKLRVLQFGKCLVPELNSSVGKLKHLRCLQLEGAKELPESLFTLYHLQFLDLRRGSIDKLPNSLKNLAKLRRLSLPSDAYSQILEIGKLISLQELKVYDATQYGGLQQLGNLQQLRGRLKISGLENAKDKAAGIAAKLNAKRHLEELKLRWMEIEDGDSEDKDGDAEDILMHRDEDVLEGLESHPNLQKLTIQNYRGAKPSSWMRTLNNLISLELSFCPNLIKIIDNPDCLPNLTSLKLLFCPSLNIQDDLLSRMKELIIGECPQLMLMLSFLAGEDLSSSVISSSSYEEVQSKTSSCHQPSSSLERLEIRGSCGLEEKTLNGFLKMRFSSLSSLTLCALPLITCLCLGPHLTALKRLAIMGLENLMSIQDMRSVKSLEELTVQECPMLRTIEGGGENIIDCRFSSIEESLWIDEPLMLPVLLHQQGLNSLTELVIEDCSQDVGFTVEQEDVFPHLTSLTHLNFDFCGSIPSLPETLDSLSSLKKLEIECCRKLNSLPSLPASLEMLVISRCPKIESLPSLPSSLRSLSMRDCPQLKEKYEEGGPLRPQIHHIPHIWIEERSI